MFCQIIQFRNFELQRVAPKHSPLQQFFSVLQFKAEYEAKHGSVKSDVLAKLYEEIKFANPDDAVPGVQLYIYNRGHQPLAIVKCKSSQFFWIIPLAIHFLAYGGNAENMLVETVNVK